MTRRSLVALISASVILALVLVAAIAVLMTTQTDFGRERIRRLVVARATSAIGKRGKLYIGRISGSLFTEIVVDSLSLRDAEDSLVIATGPLRLTFDPRDLLDQRIHLHKVDISRPMINLRRHSNDVWNFHTIFPEGKKSKIHTPGFGDYIVADSVTLHDGTLWLTEPWLPDDSLKGARRDSAVRYALARTWPEVRNTKEGLKRTRRWTRLNIEAPRARIATPDSAGVTITLASLATVENDPPTEVRNLRGTVHIQGDSVWLALSHFDLPATTGHATAHIWWGGTKPTQLDLHAVADSVSLKDFAWVYPGMPHSGGGTTELYLKNDPKDLRVLEYALKGLDLHTTNSHLRGDMTFGVGGPVLIVKDVAMHLEPADFDLLRAFNGGTFPVDFRGQFTGSVYAPGGPINRWRVDSADVTFRDAHVPGAVSHIDASGELDLLIPSLARFRGFDLSFDALDLRTVTYLFPNFPRLGGTITGSATLDSIWTDVRFSDADIEHHDGPEDPTHITGSGRITSSEPLTRFDVTLAASPISFSELAHSYPSLPLRGSMSGPVRVQGAMDQLALTTRLTGDAGTLVVDEILDIDSTSGEGARGTVRAEALDLAQLLQRPSIPATRLFAAISNDVHGESLATTFGTVDLTVDSSRVADIRVPHATARARVADGHLLVDSLTLTSTGVRALGSGMLGLAAGAHDTLRFTADIDSLGGLRSLIATSHPDAGDTSSMSAGELLARARRDSLDGTFSIAGFLAGSVADSFTASATFLGDHLVRGTDAAVRLAGGVEIVGLPKTPAGTLWMRLDSVSVAGVGIDTVHAMLAMRGPDSGAVTLAVITDRPAGAMRAGAGVRFSLAPGVLRVTLDTLRLVTGGKEGHSWRLGQPAHFQRDRAGDQLDSLVLRGGGGGTITAHANLPATGAIQAFVVADTLSLADVGAIAQTASALGGYLSGDLRVTGTRDDPVMHLTTRFRDARFGTITFPYFALDADYAKRQLTSRLDFFDRGQSVATLELALPANLALNSVPDRFPDEPFTGRLRADSVDISILSALSPFISRPLGTANVDLALSGTLRSPQFTGFFKLKDGEVGLTRYGVRLTNVQSAIAFAPGEIKIDTLSMQSGGVKGNFMSLTGTLKAPALLTLADDRSGLVLDLHMAARNFQLLDSRRLARMEITDDVSLTGRFSGATLSGHINVDKADFYLADLERKKTVVDLDDPELFADPAVAANRELQSTIPPDVRDALAKLHVDNLDVVIGDKVWLRSDIAEIKLGGAVVITGSGTQKLTGKIDVQHGTYRLDLGLVQRTFTVDSGSVRFYGDIEQGGRLDVWASSVVRQANRQGEDVKILAHITGTTDDPQPEFSSGERYALSEPEILSYLIFGQPSFVQGTNTAGNTAAAALLPSLGTVMERAISNQLRWVDQITIQTGATTPQSDQYAALYGSRLGVGKQLGDRTYVAANAGLCWLQGTSTGSTSSFSQSLGFSVDQQLGNRFTLQASREPGSASMLCKPDATDIGSRPSQYGIDLFREWSF